MPVRFSVESSSTDSLRDEITQPGELHYHRPPAYCMNCEAEMIAPMIVEPCNHRFCNPCFQRIFLIQRKPCPGCRRAEDIQRKSSPMELLAKLTSKIERGIPSSLALVRNKSVMGTADGGGLDYVELKFLYGNTHEK